MSLRILYLPVIEPGAHHATAIFNKRGLFDAMRAYGEVEQFDYLAVPTEAVYGETLDRLYRLRPQLMVTQLHGATQLTARHMADIRRRFPTMRIVNWSGDSWLHSLTSPAMLELCRQFDFQLVASPDVLPIYAEHRIRAWFWQIAYEAPIGPLPTMPSYDVVFLGNIISEPRRKMLEFLRTLKDVRVGIYGDWQHADGVTLYDFGAGEALYKNATIAIADNAYVDQTNYVSNRPIQILMAGGAVLLHQHVPKMAELLGIEAGIHYIEWHDFADLERLIRFYIDSTNNEERQGTVWVGQAYARSHHTYAERAHVLFAQLLRGALTA